MVALKQISEMLPQTNEKIILKTNLISFYRFGLK
jgi:hypothetical protein